MRILLSRTDRMGDLILSTPAIATVRKSYPDAHITMVCSPYNSVVMERNTDVDELVQLPREVKASSYGRNFRDTDIAIALAPRAQDLSLVGATRARLRVGYTYVRRYVMRATARLYVNRLMISEADPQLCERDPHRHVRHEVNQLLDLVALAGAHDRVAALRLDVTAEDRAAVASLPQSPVVVHLGMRWFTEGSTLDSTIRLIRDLHELGHPVVVTYAAECEPLIPEIRAAGVADSLLGGLPFHHWVAVFERARVIVTVDTGATHVASAVRRPTVVAFEHRYFRLNSQEWAPYGVPCALVRKPADETESSLAQFRQQIYDAVNDLLDS